MGNSKQYDFNEEMIQLNEDLSDSLQKSFEDMGLVVPPSIKTVLEQGIKKLKERNRDLLRADDAGWHAVEQFHRDPLCDNETEEKRWKRAKKEAKERKEKKATGPRGGGGGGGGGVRVGRGRGGGGYSLRGFGPQVPAFVSGHFGRGRGAWQDSWRRSTSKSSSVLGDHDTFAGLSSTQGGGQSEFPGNCRRCHKYGHKAENCHVALGDKKATQ